MRALPFLLVILALALAIGPPAARACGGPFLVTSRGNDDTTAFTTLRPSVVMLLQDEVGGQPLFPEDLAVELADIGHEVHLVPMELVEQGLAGGDFQVLLLSWSRIAEVEALLGRMRDRPLFLPILVDPTPAELGQAEELYGAAFAIPGEKSQLFRLIDELAIPRSRGSS